VYRRWLPCVPRPSPEDRRRTGEISPVRHKYLRGGSIRFIFGYDVAFLLFPNRRSCPVQSDWPSCPRRQQRISSMHEFESLMGTGLLRPDSSGRPVPFNALHACYPTASLPIYSTGLAASRIPLLLPERGGPFFRGGPFHSVRDK